MRPWFLSENLPASPSLFLKTALGKNLQKERIWITSSNLFEIFQDVKTTSECICIINRHRASYGEVRSSKSQIHFHIMLSLLHLLLSVLESWKAESSRTRKEP